MGYYKKNIFRIEGQLLWFVIQKWHNLLYYERHAIRAHAYLSKWLNNFLIVHSDSHQIYTGLDNCIFIIDVAETEKNYQEVKQLKSSLFVFCHIFSAEITQLL